VQGSGAAAPSADPSGPTATPQLTSLVVWLTANGLDHQREAS
jgi:hypothetical protein